MNNHKLDLDINLGEFLWTQDLIFLALLMIMQQH